MRILCDQHVDYRYVHALQRADGITVTTVRHVMSADAPDGEIASYAAANDPLVLTSDDYFTAHSMSSKRPLLRSSSVSGAILIYRYTGQ